VQGWSSFFIFATLDGTISGWAPQSNPNASIIAVNNWAAGASYTALAITNRPSGNLLYAANLPNNVVEVYDANFNLVNTFTDPRWADLWAIRHRGYQRIGLCNLRAHRPCPERQIDVFQEDGTFVKVLAKGEPLNQPYSLAVAPSNFGPLSNTLLVGPNLNHPAPISGFNLATGQFVAPSKTPTARISPSTNSGDWVRRGKCQQWTHQPTLLRLRSL